ncbi:uncharacterized protein LOC125608214 [Brassica napus]|uniref:uncharacterized protein LOC125608214 n=1 Tax=Brassica napus TaxID=3708 RepID=UPI002078B0F1|nr:uncharacterized protein LOC125608214 [Brassica napus]
MSHRYSRTEKGKERAEEFPPRKPLVRIPDANVSGLIERNKLTLIGRVTNPSIQKTRALVDFFLQQWNVVGRITGRDLGPTLFQFGFESERDLQTILAKAPFHFKNWMFILQRWEPVVSDSFPGRIPFWIRVHGIPLHYWIDETIEAIGAALGPIDDREVDKARLRVQVNGLKPLIMKMDLQLPSREIVEVELEYEKIVKHCFFCKSLDHEDSEKRRCPLSRSHHGERRDLGISQQNTLERIEEGRRRQDDRRFSRQQNLANNRVTRWTNTRNANPHSDVVARVYSSRNESGRSSEFEENKRRYDDRSLSHRSATPRGSRTHHTSHEHTSNSRREGSYRVKEHTGSVLPQEQHGSPVRDVTSRSHLSPVTNPSADQRRASLASRLSDPRSEHVSSEDRIPAKERLSVNTMRTAERDLANSEALGPLVREKIPTKGAPLLLNDKSITRPSSSTIFESGRIGLCERSPIRTLSEDRIHVSLRLGSLRADEDEEQDNVFDLQLQQALSTKAAGKRIAENSQDCKRMSKNTGQGITVKRRRVTKVHSSPRRKLMLDAITAGGRSQTRKKLKNGPTTKLIPAIVRKEKDFHPLQGSLP